MSCNGYKINGVILSSHALGMDGADLSSVMHCLGTNGVIVIAARYSHCHAQSVIAVRYCHCHAQSVIAVRYSHCHAQSEHRTVLTNVMDAFGMNTAVLTTYWV